MKIRISRPLAALCGVTVASCLSVPLSAAAATTTGTTAQYVFSPNPIGTEGAVPAGSTVTVVLTAEDSVGSPVPNAPVYLAFKQATGGGSANVQGVALRLIPHEFFADSSGRVSVTYQAPATYPSSGDDILKAQNASTASASTVVGTDAFAFSPISSFTWVRKPIAKPGSLVGNVTIPVVLTASGPSGPAAGATVYLAFFPCPGGATASVNGVKLTSARQGFVTDSSGQVTVSYTTALTVPTTGVDVLVATNAAKQPTARLADRYSYAPRA